jgi:ABC-type polysaccharide/polyol phosphate transport system ATPase subunit
MADDVLIGAKGVRQAYMIGRMAERERYLFAEIEKLLDAPFKRYSLCMYARLAFAVAARLEREVLSHDRFLNNRSDSQSGSSARQVVGVDRKSAEASGSR